MGLDPRGDALKNHRAACENCSELELVYQTVPIGLCVLDRDLKFVRVNERLAAISGRSVLEHLGRTVDEVMPELARKITSDLRGVVASGNALMDREVIVKIHADEGAESCLSMSCYPLKAEDGTVFGISVLVEDVSERTRIQAGIISAKKDWEQTFDAVPDLIALLDDRQRIVRVNKTMADRLGGRPDKFIGLFCHELLHGGGETPTACPRALVIADGKPHAAEMYIERLGGYFQVTVVPLKEHAGRMSGCVHVAHDLSSRMQAEEALRESEARLRAAIESIPFDFFLIDQNGRYVMQNATCKEHWGEIIGKRPEDVAPDEETLTLWRENNRRAFAGDIVKGEVDLQPRGEDGFYYNIVSPVYERDQIKSILGVNIDITARRRAEIDLWERYEFETLIAELSAEFVSLTSVEVDAAIERSLKRLVDYLGVGRSAIMQFADDQSQLRVTHSYTVEGVTPPSLIDLGENLPWFTAALRQGAVLKSSGLDDISGEAEDEMDYLRRAGVKAALTIPLLVGGDVIGGLSFFAFKSGRSWPDDLIKKLRLIGEIFANAVARRRQEDILAERLRFEKLIADLSAGFVRLPVADVDVEIERGLETLVTFLGVDRAVLWQRGDMDSRLLATHCYALSGVPAVSGLIMEEQLPLTAARMHQGKISHVRDTTEIPSDAGAERRYFKQFGVKSGLAMPMIVGENFLGALTLVSLQAEQTWPVSMVQRLMLVGSIFANALIRQKAEQSLARAFLEIEQLKEKLEAECYYLREEIKLDHNFGNIIGQSRLLGDVLLKVERVAPTDTSALILGETGSGKELIARAIHGASRRRERPLVKVNCAALPPDLIESELFGHEKGAYTGALSRQLGRFEVANHATIFLDEIGELPLKLQAKLLRVLQDGEFERLGSPQTIKVDVRVIAATNRDLAREVKEGRFREDLWYRLNVYPIQVPPLRERTEDIPLLTRYFVDRFAKRQGKVIETIPQGVVETLKAYGWPGNVRELENVIERAVISSDGPQLRLAERLDALTRRQGLPSGRKSLMEMERHHIEQTLAEAGGKIEGPGGAAELLALNPSTLRARMRKLGIRRK
jgi:formate hydrogenlyase transcriptional activator